MSWQPTASWPLLRQRAQWLAAIRQFFADRGAWEVETPILARAATPEVHLHSFSTVDGYFLPTSPEFFMKRLLAAGSGDIYQIARVFRREERGPRHQPEFTLVEWYRGGMDDRALMTEVADLVRTLLAAPALPVTQLAYADAFEAHLGRSIATATAADYRRCGADHGLVPPRLDDADRDAWRDWLLTHVIEAQLGQTGLCFLTDYPPSQASLARCRVDDKGHTTAARFELYWRGVELANGFWELTDAEEQRRRFVADNATRRAHGLPAVPLDESLLAALAAGLPDCAGVALGLDRLLMLANDLPTVAQTMAFADELPICGLCP